jgi:hypothetical protein
MLAKITPVMSLDFLKAFRTRWIEGTFTLAPEAKRFSPRYAR